ncbi:MAG: anthranilate phosphoribosyltransferase [Sphingobium sp.]|nr:anthranilate phosphoribosyltransferase [Sphingobium sp.]MBP6111506.1 anthranilate phosphoribosyltransferase [Sphingobium sp.]MBP8669875.1 anthranilate phosphoribosyltransferase [Sphingobium sp.]MBP9156364.1 anthranilate phosphoribosyltransferase [Sphingobium sp.]MCC6481189.1 anthranilate phosphoribosyltransferase [Sphingomonadaceae bacterium]
MACFLDPASPMMLEEAKATFGAMLDGAGTDEEVAAFLVALADRGETSAEIAGAALAMRERMIAIEAPDTAIDVCGTGGDGQHTLNVSTAVALVVAACGVPVAKHGNRAASSKAGGADVLEALGVNLAITPDVAEAQLHDLGICFLFAQAHHPALKRLAPIRKSIGKRTIFNLLGPLANPARVRRQLVGVAKPALVGVYAEAMRLLGTERAMIVAGDEGLDELSISGVSQFVSIGFDLGHTIIAPEGAGLPRHPLSAIRGGDPAYNAAALRRLLEGEAGAYRDAVLLNAAAALIVAGQARDGEDGIEEAAEAIDKGLANALLNCWIAWQ